MNCRFKELECPGSKPSDTERKRRAMQIARAICIEEKPPALVVAKNLSCERRVLWALRASLRARCPCLAANAQAKKRTSRPIVALGSFAARTEAMCAARS
jgi:hypothetical protein